MFIWPAGGPSSCLSVLRGKNFNVGHYTQTVEPNLLIGTIDFYHFMPLTDHAWGSQGQHEAKPIGVFFSHSFDLIGMNFDVVMKQLKLNILRLLLSRMYWNKGNNCCLLTTFNKKSVGMHSDIYKWIWIKFGMIIDVVALCIVILIWLTLTLIEYYRSAREQTLLQQLSPKLFNWFQWNLVHCWDLLVWWTSYSF